MMEVERLAPLVALYLFQGVKWLSAVCMQERNCIWN